MISQREEKRKKRNAIKRRWSLNSIFFACVRKIPFRSKNWKFRRIENKSAIIIVKPLKACQNMNARLFYVHNGFYSKRTYYLRLHKRSYHIHMFASFAGEGQISGKVPNHWKWHFNSILFYPFVCRPHNNFAHWIQFNWIQLSCVSSYDALNPDMIINGRFMLSNHTN